MKKMFLLILFSASITNAQLKEKYEKGWVITNDNTKIDGYIKTDDLSNLSSKICFKRNLEEKKCQVYDTTKISSFQKTNGSIFNLLKLKINNKQNKITVFANLIFKGEKVSLYKSTYESEVFYILYKDNKKYVLQNDKLISDERRIRKYNFIGTLNFVTEGLALLEKPAIKFNEDDFIKIVAKYNSSKKAKSEDLRIKEKTVNFFIISGGLGFEKNGTEYYGQIIYRKYYPEISRSTSLNFGISYFNYQFKELNNNFTQSLISIPLQIQQNILNKKIRPYFFVGFSINYLQLKDKNANSLLEQGFQKTYGFNLLYGAGIEIDIFNNIYLKSEYRNEAYSHPISIGIGYILK
ncbi:hypothetical protein [Polaribacter porphyrae]|uniref:Outer membrane protein beta-barrel domain-containing protein n=1 Tax=Polaribacter porphyrae TaxID=1137780 RepID=A0A2S7WL10_9FLAO|nr:hypothetical protein [Polaribacter porphyrae]PQJ78288.1 hypothetical protein BTO18_03370 [Polaribacter porphyrae]